MLDRIEALGKPVFITEIGVPSRDDDLGTTSSDEASSPAHRWDRERQADWAEDMFTVLMSRPDVVGIAWYDLVDRRPFLPGGGLLDRAWRPKPVYRRMERILAEAGRIPNIVPRRIEGEFVHLRGREGRRRGVGRWFHRAGAHRDLGIELDRVACSRERLGAQPPSWPSHPRRNG
jgi:hypothetical protein